MRRLLVILLMLFVPFQATWAGAAAYCEHEAGSVAQTHFGHHTHVDMGAEEKSPGSKPAVHADCLACHMVAAHALLADDMIVVAQAPVAAARFARAPAPLPSGPVSLPERPNWFRLA